MGTLRDLRWLVQRAFKPNGRTDDRQELEMDDFDARYGVDTAATSEIADLAAIQSANYIHGHRYQTLTADTGTQLLQELAIPYEDFVFLDMGSGKGKMLLVAAQFPFRKIVGVEYSELLHDIAVQNIRRYANAAQRSFDIRSICIDVTQFRIPADALVIFLFNPFDGVLMRDLVGRLEESLRSRPRQILVVYWNPVHAGVFSRSEFETRVRGDGYVVLEHDPARRGR